MHQRSRLRLATTVNIDAVRRPPPTEPPGVAVRTRSSRAVIGADGKRRNITTSTEIVEFYSGPIDASLLDVPPGFRRTEISTPGFSAQLDSLNRAAVEHVFSRMVDSALVIVGQTRTCTTDKGASGAKP